MIKWFFHVAIMDMKAREIVDEILNYMDSSWLLNELDELHIWVIWWEIFTNNPKIIVHNFWNDFHKYEFPTLKMLHDECEKDPDIKVFYVHTKWASKPFSTYDVEWRRAMLKCVVNNYKLCISKLNEYDTVWIRMLMENWNVYPRHYSWNFRRANASYINTLCNFEWKTNDRYFAEWRICSNKNVLYCNLE